MPLAQKSAWRSGINGLAPHRDVAILQRECNVVAHFLFLDDKFLNEPKGPAQLDRRNPTKIDLQKIAKAAKPAVPTFTNSAHFCSKFSSEKQAIALPMAWQTHR